MEKRDEEAGEQVVIYPQLEEQPGFASTAVIVLGVIQIMIGVLCMGDNIIGLAIAAPHYKTPAVISAGLWVGLLIIFAGSFGIVAGLKKTMCPIIAFMVLCILSSIFVVALAIQGFIGILVVALSGLGGSSYHRDPDTEAKLSLALIILAVVEFIIAIICSIICCCTSTMCKSRPTDQPNEAKMEAMYTPAAHESLYPALPSGPPQ